MELRKVPDYHICQRNGRWNDRFDVTKILKAIINIKKKLW